ncbi:hypothetical protein [Dehalococcoides mccartyi]|uniref:hypothetical protein n=2 Tax=Dehalococcoides TaxID=61434 RepID=UPI000805DFE7|nr:hypothetical protein [Dehalococcoides mccartyi]OBW61629.1 MAG: hypothetical protein A9181_01095 [Dehalococcoides mccartyi]
MSRIRKTAVPETKAREWVERYKNGETPPQIATKDSYDVRTVRKYLKQFEKQAEISQARTMVYHEALQAHYKDFIDLAKRLIDSVNLSQNIPIESSDPLLKALYDHIPYSVLWKKITWWNELIEKENRYRKDLKAKLEQKIHSDKGLKSAYIGGNMDTVGLQNVMFKQTEMLIVQKPLSFNVEKNLTIDEEHSSNMALIIKYASYNIGTITPANVTNIKNALSYFEKNLSDIILIKDLHDLIKDRESAREAIIEQLNIIILKRVVPGHCRYCPF